MPTKHRIKLWLKNTLAIFISFTLIAPLFVSYQPLISRASEKSYNLAVILVEKEIWEDADIYNTETFSGKIYRYADDIQNTLNDTKTLVLPVSSQENYYDIYKVLENLYLEGEKSETEINHLVGVVLIGDVPLPVIRGDSTDYSSVFPYVDFASPAFIYNPQEKAFVPNSSSMSTEAEIWHGIIRPKGSNEERSQTISDFFDKNHNFRTNKEYTDSVLFMDLSLEEQGLNQDNLDSYEQRSLHRKDFAFNYYDNELLKEATGDVVENINDLGLEEYMSDTLKGLISKMGDDSISYPSSIVKKQLDKLWPEYVNINNSSTSKMIEFVGRSGRWHINNEDASADIMPILITQTDLFAQNYIRSSDDYLEQKIIDVAENWQVPVEFTASTGCIEDINTDDSYETTIYVNGKKMKDISSVEECSLYKGSNTGIAEFNRTYNISTVNNCTNYAGCCANNLFSPSACSPSQSLLPVFDYWGNKGADSQIAPNSYHDCVNNALYVTDYCTNSSPIIKNLSSVVVHNEPRNETLTKILSTPYVMVDQFPIDRERYLNFKGLNDSDININFINLFDISGDDLEKSLIDREKEIEQGIMSQDLKSFESFVALSLLPNSNQCGGIAYMGIGMYKILSPEESLIHYRQVAGFDNFLAEAGAYLMSVFPEAESSEDAWVMHIRNVNNTYKNEVKNIFKKHIPAYGDISFEDFYAQNGQSVNIGVFYDTGNYSDDECDGIIRSTLDLPSRNLPEKNFLFGEIDTLGGNLLVDMMNWGHMNADEKHKEIMSVFLGSSEEKVFPGKRGASYALANLRMNGTEDTVYWQGLSKIEDNSEWNELGQENPDEDNGDGDNGNSDSENSCGPIEGVDIFEWPSAIICWMDHLVESVNNISSDSSCTTSQGNDNWYEDETPVNPGENPDAENPIGEIPDDTISMRFIDLPEYINMGEVVEFSIAFFDVSGKRVYLPSVEIPNFTMGITSGSTAQGEISVNNTKVSIIAGDKAGVLQIYALASSYAPAMAEISVVATINADEFAEISPNAVFAGIFGLPAGSLSYEKKTIADAFLYDGKAQAVFSQILPENLPYARAKINGYKGSVDVYDNSLGAKIANLNPLDVEIYDKNTGNSLAEVNFYFPETAKLYPYYSDNIESGIVFENFDTSGLISSAEENNELVIKYENNPVLSINSTTTFSLTNNDFSLVFSKNALNLVYKENIVVGKIHLKGNKLRIISADAGVLGRNYTIGGEENYSIIGGDNNRNTFDEELGWGGENKFALLWASAETTGEASKSAMTPEMVLLGDPTIALKKKEAPNGLSYNKTIGKEIFSSKEFLINDVKTIQFDGDDERDLILSSEDGIMRVLSGQDFKDLTDTLSSDGGFSLINKDGDGFDDLIIQNPLTSISNNKEVLTQEYLELENFNSAESADFNEDSYTDIVAYTEANEIRIYWGGTEGFSKENSTLLEDFSMSLNTEENLSNLWFSYDGIEDIATASNSINMLRADDMSSHVFVKAESSSLENLSRKLEDENGGDLEYGDTVKYTVSFSANGEENLAMADSILDNIEISSVDCENCLVNLPSASDAHFRIFDIPNEGEITIIYQGEVQKFAELDFSVLDYNSDGYSDIFVSFPSSNLGSFVLINNKNGTFTAQNSTSSEAGSEDLPDYAKEDTYVDLDGNGVPDKFEKDSDGDGIPDFAKDAINNNLKDSDGDGLPDVLDDTFNVGYNHGVAVIGLSDETKNTLGNVNTGLTSIISLLEGLSCNGGSCLPIPINYSFLTAGSIGACLPSGVAGSIGVVPIALPVIGALVHPPYVCTGAACMTPSSPWRFYISPTLTGALAFAYCTGPGIAGMCMFYATPIPGTGALCSMIDNIIDGILDEAGGLTGSLLGNKLFNVDGYGSYNNSDASTDASMSYSLGKFSFSVKSSNNRRMFGTPGFFDKWITRQMNEVSGMFSGFSVHLLYPSVDSIFSVGEMPEFKFTEMNFENSGVNMDTAESVYDNAETAIDNINEIWKALNSIPLIDIKYQTVEIKVPYLTSREINAIKEDFALWKEDLQNMCENTDYLSCDGDSVKFDGFSCEGLSEEDCTLAQSAGDRISADISATVSAMNTNEAILKEYQDLPNILSSYDDELAEYLDSILCTINRITDLFGGWILKNKIRLEKWIEAIETIKAIVKIIQKFPDLFKHFKETCEVCKAEQCSLNFSIWQILISLIPTPPIIKLPRLPDIVIDFSFRKRIEIVVPKLKILPERIKFPRIPRLSLPDFPNGNIRIPGIPILPHLPSFPELPSLPSLGIPELPLLPPPPKLPNIFKDVEGVLDVIDNLLTLYCIIFKKYIFIYPEYLLKNFIEGATLRSKELLPFDFFRLDLSAFDVDATIYNEINVNADMNLSWDGDYIAEAVKSGVEPWNEITTDLDVENVLKQYDLGDFNANDYLKVEDNYNYDIEGVSKADGLSQDEADKLSYQKVVESSSDRIQYLMGREKPLEDVSVIYKQLNLPPVSLPKVDNYNLNEINKLSTQIKSELKELNERKREVLAYEDVFDLEDEFVLTASEENIPPEETCSLATSPLKDVEKAGAYKQGVFITKEDGSAEKLIEYSDEASDVRAMLFADLDNDSDEDIVYAMENKVYLKENLDIENVKSTYPFDPKIGVFEDLIPYREALKNFNVQNGTSSASFSWFGGFEDDLLGVQISLRNTVSSFDKNNSTENREILLLAESEIPSEIETDKWIEKTSITIGDNEIFADKFYVSVLKSNSVNIPTEEGFSYARIRQVFEGNFSTYSEQGLVHISLQNDTTKPIFVSEHDFYVPILKETTISVEGVFDDEGYVSVEWADGTIGASKVVGPYDDVVNEDMKIILRDKAGNENNVTLTIHSYVPSIYLESAVEGYMNPAESNFPFVLMRERWGENKMIKTDSADENGRYFTDENGRYSIDDLNISKDAYVSDENGEIIAIISAENGRIILQKDGYLIQVYPASDKFPTRQAIVNSEDQIVANVYFISDADSDVRIDSAPMTQEKSESASGVYSYDTNNSDEYLAGTIPSGSPSFAGGIAIFNKNTDEIVALVSPHGSIRFLVSGLNLTLKTEDSSDPVIFNLNKDSSKLFEIYIHSDFENIFILHDVYMDKIVALFNQQKDRFFGADDIEFPFSDINKNHPYYEAIKELYDRNILKGFADGTFRPDNKISRAEFVKIALGATTCLDCTTPTKYEKEEYPEQNPFPDVHLYDWFHFCIVKAKALSMVMGFGDGYFHPDWNISRAEAVAILIRQAGIELEIESDIKIYDLLDYAWYKDYIHTAFNLGIIEDHDGFVFPDEEITRGEFAMMSKKLLDIQDCQIMDIDKDGLPDFWEHMYGLDPNNPADSLVDSDNDGVNNLGAYQQGVSPYENLDNGDGNGIDNGDGDGNDGGDGDGNDGEEDCSSYPDGVCPDDDGEEDCSSYPDGVCPDDGGEEDCSEYPNGVCPDDGGEDCSEYPNGVCPDGGEEDCSSYPDGVCPDGGGECPELPNDECPDIDDGGGDEDPGTHITYGDPTWCGFLDFVADLREGDRFFTAILSLDNKNIYSKSATIEFDTE